ncbi:hypothetical protein PNK_1487 [Candidatus Protochlamydia naegleriophila]|uniref:Uncharacterized protein n=1 Tax=Candidatus Protochlamydia naegleriophila TaxID=389348 RepID=A0A0U5JAN6_9BACT|nr:hypothetical protein [Candidatus Protochlamydia naegleriophila]CUI17097.1 hypothetical protein PNK_1487 [Candidatus Protochlamydia naegleriophila]
MNPGFVPIARGTEKITSYTEHEPAFSSEADINQIEEEEEEFAPVSKSLTVQERRRLITQGLASERLPRINNALSAVNINGRQFKSWVDVISSNLIQLASKVAKAEAKTILRIVEETRLRKNLAKCWHNLAVNFQQFCQKIKQDHSF